MRRLALTLTLLALSGCVVTTSTVVPDAPPPPPQVVEVWYGGQHGVPASVGGGWCYYDGPHVHDYFPEPLDWYAFADGFYFWRGPVTYTYVGGHPMPGGGWCFIDVPHRHDYVPPYGGGFTWRGSGWIYGGPYSSARPPPPTWWNYAPPRPPPPGAVRPPPPSAYRPPPPPMRRPVPPPRPVETPRPPDKGQGSGHDQGPDRDHDQGHGKGPGQGRASASGHQAALPAGPASGAAAGPTDRKACDFSWPAADDLAGGEAALRRGRPPSLAQPAQPGTPATARDEAGNPAAASGDRQASRPAGGEARTAPEEGRRPGQEGIEAAASEGPGKGGAEAGGLILESRGTLPAP